MDMVRSGIVCCDLFLICVICILFFFHFSVFWIVYILFLYFTFQNIICFLNRLSLKLFITVFAITVPDTFSCCITPLWSWKASICLLFSGSLLAFILFLSFFLSLLPRLLGWLSIVGRGSRSPHPVAISQLFTSTFSWILCFALVILFNDFAFREPTSPFPTFPFVSQHAPFPPCLLGSWQATLPGKGFGKTLSTVR